MMKGKLYLIPTPLGDYAPQAVLPQAVLDIVCSLDTFIVEEERTARRFLSAAGLKGHIANLEFHVLNEHTDPKEVESFASLFNDGHDVGLLSEAGLPAVADPGALAVALCHRTGVEVVPLTGPSSLMMALMSSGLNGQSFAFCGYLPAKTDERRKAILSIEKNSQNLRQTQIFIETPYRNDSLLRDLASTLSGETRLCVAADITLPSQTIRSSKVAEWRRLLSEGYTIGKRPCVFCLLK